jgi:hypothetical protein
MKDLGQAIPDSHDEVTDEPSPIARRQDWAPGSVHSWKVFYQSASCYRILYLVVPSGT